MGKRGREEVRVNRNRIDRRGKERRRYWVNSKERMTKCSIARYDL